MLRSRPLGSLTRSILRSVASKSRRTSNLAITKARPVSIQYFPVSQQPVNQALITHHALSLSLQKYASTDARNLPDHINRKEESILGKQKLESHPEEVSELSTVHQIFHEKTEKEEEPDIDMLAGIKSDMV